MTESTDVYLSLGSNLGDRAGNLRDALRRLAERVDVVAISPTYSTAPVGVTDQPRFLNIAAHVRTSLSPQELLRAVKSIEEDLGRVPTYRWGPRLIDIDIILYGARVVNDPNLVIPHREAAHRAFVLVPLAQLAPSVMHPVLGRTVGELAADSHGAEDVQPEGRL